MIVSTISDTWMLACQTALNRVGNALMLIPQRSLPTKKMRMVSLKKMFNVVVDKHCRLCFQGYLDWICSGMANKKNENGKLKKEIFFQCRR
jgi:hypothetical protein